MAIAFVAGTLVTGGSTSGAVNMTGVTLLLASLSYVASTGDGITDSQGNTWVKIAESVAVTRVSSLWYVANSSVSSSMTFSPTAGFGRAAFAGFSGVATSSPLDQTSAGGAVSGTSIQPGSITPSQNDCLIASCFEWDNSDTASIDSSFTISNQGGSPNPIGAAFGYLIQTTAAAVNPTWSIASSALMASRQASFKAAAAAAGQPTMRRWGGVRALGGPGLPGGKGSGRAWGRTRSGIIVPRRLAA